MNCARRCPCLIFELLAFELNASGQFRPANKDFKADGANCANERTNRTNEEIYTGGTGELCTYIIGLNFGLLPV